MSNQTSTRMGQHELHHPTELNLYHKNPRVGDVDAIAASLRANSQYKPVTVNRGTHTGRPMEVLAGNHTIKAFRDLAEKYPDEDRWQRVDCWVLDVDEDRANRIVLADNRTSELGSFDDEQLYEVLNSLNDSDFEGTGYSDVDFKALAEALNGAPSLDDLAKEYGEPTEEDVLEALSFKIDRDLMGMWQEHRMHFDSDSEALRDLLERGVTLGEEPEPEVSAEA